jgi:hypothetical protein
VELYDSSAKVHTKGLFLIGGKIFYRWHGSMPELPPGKRLTTTRQMKNSRHRAYALKEFLLNA